MQYTQAHWLAAILLGFSFIILVIHVYLQPHVLSDATMLGSLHLHIDAELPQGHYNVQHTLKLDDGVIGVYGDSGQGKTTLLKIIAGLIEVNPNALTWSNSAYQSLSPEQNCVVYQAQTPLFICSFNRHTKLTSRTKTCIASVFV